MPQITLQNFDQVFTYHAPQKDQIERYAAIREAGRSMAGVILANCPESPERTLALRDIQRAVMMANAAVALEHLGR